MILLCKMKMTFLVILTYFCLLTPFSQAQNSNSTIYDLALKNMDFAMNLYRRISSRHDKNIFFAPLSISTSFATLLMASDGVTHQEILKSFNLEQLEKSNQPDIIPELFQLLHENVTQNGSLKLDQSMALFMHPEFELEKTFEENAKKYFDADVKIVDFTDSEGSKSLINGHIKRKTQDKMPEMISNVNELTKLLIISTIFFQGNWKLPFNSNLTQSAPFHIDNYNIVQVPMMFKEDKFYTMQDYALGARVLKLPYQEGVSMLILLPNQHKDYTEIEEEISGEKFLSWVEKLEKIKLEVKMPKFKIEKSYSLHHILPDMGLTSIFSNSANLTRLSKDKGLKVTAVLHKAIIEVDETGTTAAAATATGIIPYMLPKTFTVNRPFFFFIYQEETNCLLFMGRVIDPTKH